MGFPNPYQIPNEKISALRETFDEWWEKVNRTYDSDSPGFPNYRDCWNAAVASTKKPQSDGEVES